jgi:hypothetical protein
MRLISWTLRSGSEQSALIMIYPTIPLMAWPNSNWCNSPFKMKILLQLVCHCVGVLGHLVPLHLDVTFVVSNLEQ